MTFISAIRTTLPLLMVLCALPVQAWSPKGHRLIGALADTELTPEARAEVARLLGSRTPVSLAEIANWADDLRDEHPELGRRTSRWHYVNLAENGCRYVMKRDCPNGDCVIEAIERQRRLLADRRQPDAVRAQALKFIAHFVGDAHQPLHTGHAADRGGNDIQVNLAGKGSNLHRIWDGNVIDSARMNERRYLSYLERMPLPPDAGGRPGTAATWASASCRVVLRKGFYPAKAAIEPSYFTQWRPVADLQLRLAGHRLASLLNASL